MASTTALHARASLAPRSHLRPLALACTLAASPTGRDQNSGFNIRGLEGNRVLMLVDGVRLPRSYTFSANFLRLFQGRQYVPAKVRALVDYLLQVLPQQAQLNWPVPDGYRCT